MSIRKTITVVLLILPILSFGQEYTVLENGVFVLSDGHLIGASSDDYTPPGPQYQDDFDDYAASSTLAGQGYWEQEYGTMTIYKPASDGEVYANNSSAMSGVYYDASISTQHYSQLKASAVSSPYLIGPGVRLQGGTGDGYSWYSGSTASYLIRWNTGSNSVLATGNAWSTDDVIKLACNGDTIFCYKNGELDTSMDLDGYYIDNSGSKHTGGYAGLIGYDAGSSSRVDDWSAGTFPGSGGDDEPDPPTGDSVWYDLAHALYVTVPESQTTNDRVGKHGRPPDPKRIRVVAHLSQGSGSVFDGGHVDAENVVAGAGEFVVVAATQGQYLLSGSERPGRFRVRVLSVS